MVAGVAGGLGEYTGTDPIVFRVLFGVLAVFGGVGLLLYLVAWLFLPDSGEEASPAESLVGRGGNRNPGTSVEAVLLAVGAAVLGILLIRGDAGDLALLAVVLIGGVILVRALNDRDSGPRPAAGPPPGYPGYPPPGYSPGYSPPGYPQGYSPPGQPPGPPQYGPPYGQSPSTSYRPYGSTYQPYVSYGASFDPPAGTGATGATAASTPAETPADTPAGAAATGTSSVGAAPVGTAGWSAGPTAWPAGPTAWSTDPAGQTSRMAAATAPVAPYRPYDYPTGPPPRPPRERSRLGQLTLSAAAVALGVLGALDASDAVHPSARHYLALALTVVGAGLLLGAWIGRARWLVWLGVPLVIALVVTSAAETTLRGGTGDRTFTPVTASGIRDHYELGAGAITLDLRSVQFAELSVRTSARVGVGSLEVHVPADVDVTVRAHTGGGDLDLFGVEDGGPGMNRTVLDEGADGPGGGELELVLDVGLGQVVVDRA